MPCIVIMNLAVCCQNVLKFSTENRIFKRDHKLTYNVGVLNEYLEI